MSFRFTHPERCQGAPRRCRRSSLVLATGDRDRRLGLGARAVHIEPPVAHLDVVAAQQSHPLDAAGDAGHGVVLRHREDNRRSAPDQIEKFLLRLAAVGLGVELVGIVGAFAAQRQFPRRRMRQIDDTACGKVDLEPVDIGLELFGDVLAAIGAGRRGGKQGQ